MIRRLLPLATLAVLLCATPLRAQDQAPSPIARAAVTPSGPVTVGQPVTVEVSVLVPTFFRGAPRFADLDVEDALVIFNDRGRNLSERIDGRTWAGQSRSYTIYPQRPGTFDIPSIDVELTYSGGGSSVATATVSPDPIRFEATVPAAAEGLDYFISTSQLTLDESLQTPDVTAPSDDAPSEDQPGAEDISPTQEETITLRVGDSVTRTITVTVQDALSMVVPPLDLGSPEGLAAYPAPPTVSDTDGQRGERIVGTRVESTTFVAESEGQATLPAVEVSWWDVEAEQLRQASAPAVAIEVVANPDLATEFALPGEDEGAVVADEPGTRISVIDTLRRWGPSLLLVVVIAYAGAWLLRRFGVDVENLLRGDPATREEKRRFRAFREAARSQDAAGTARTFMQWLDFRNRRPGTYASFAAEAQDPVLDEQARSLGRSLYGRAGETGKWSGRELAGGVDRVRHRKRKDNEHDEPALPPLNP